MAGRLAWLAFLAVLLAAPAAHPHGMRSAYLEIHEQSPGRALVSFRLAVRAPGVVPRLPSGCRLDRALLPESVAASVRRPALWRCAAPLTGGTVAIDGLGAEVGEGVVVVSLADGRTLSHLLTAQVPQWRIPAQLGSWATATQYIGLGVRHIAGGLDHLMFLVLLVFTVRRPRAVLLAETAFTLSHSLAFAANALGYLAVAPAAAEACIALSLLLLALDLERPGNRPPAAWQSAVLALCFGAVHGLGFAGGLREAGLPDAHVGLALLGFGLGVELMQVSFVVAILAVLLLLARRRLVAQAALAVAYPTGIVATCWLFQRLALCAGLR